MGGRRVAVRSALPSGDIHATQLGLALAWDGSYRYFDGEAAGLHVAQAPTTGFGLAELSATFGEYRLRDGSGRRPGLVGARAEWRDLSGNLHGGIEAAAAARGDAAGYMELLGSVGWDHAVAPTLPALRVGARAALGLGGGGGVPGGGGLLGKALATLSWQVTPGWQLGIEAGRVEGAHGRPRASTVQASIGTTLEPRHDDASATFTELAIDRNEWVATLQRVMHVDRKSGGHGAIDTVGGSFDHWVSGPLYLTLQAHSAFAGGAGAYSTGAIGLGIASAPDRWRIGAEVTAGAAGGGGVATQGGALAQANVWIDRRLSAAGGVRFGVGETRSLRSGLQSPLLQISWSQAFGLTSARVAGDRPVSPN